MLLSRGVAALGALRHVAKQGTQFNQSVRNGGHAAWGYRKGPPPPDKKYVYMAEGVQGFMWWWILWHLWTEPEHIFGEFEYPDPRKWTDAELGIPDELELDE